MTNTIRRTRDRGPETHCTGRKDIRLDVPWISQYDHTQVARSGKSACKRACEAMLAKIGIHPEPSEKGFRIAEAETANGAVITNPRELAAALWYIDEELAAGRPVIAGVSHQPGGPNFDGITDHWVVITGRAGADYLFHDPATKHERAGRGRFVIDADDGNLAHPGAVAEGSVVRRRTELSIVIRNQREHADRDDAISSFDYAVHAASGAVNGAVAALQLLRCAVAACTRK